MTPDESQKMIAELAVITKKLSEPVDSADLEKKGILIKAGAWYRVPDFRKLPEHVRTKVRAIAQDSKGAKIKLDKATKFYNLARKFEKLAK